MTTFIIGGKSLDPLDSNFLPAQDFGYATIQAIDYANWFEGKREHHFYVIEPVGVKWLERPDAVPVGSVEFVTEALKAWGCEVPKPLNIPKELWKFVGRKVQIAELKNYCGWGPIYPRLAGKWMVKNTNWIKDSRNGFVDFDKPNKYSAIGPWERANTVFMSEWVDDIVSEWRLFVHRGEIVDLRCYSGDPWQIPDKNYANQIVKNYEKQSPYTLDLMVRKVGELFLTDIVELHDFFSCGLYGFNQPNLLLPMLSETIHQLKMKGHTL